MWQYQKREVVYFRNKYLIALYDKDDWCVGVYDNVKDLANDFSLDKKLNLQLQRSFRRALQTKSKWQGYNIFLIDIKE